MSVHVCISLIVSIWHRSGLRPGEGGAAALSTGWDCDSWIWGLGCGFPLLLAGDFCQTLVCRTRTKLIWSGLLLRKRTGPPKPHISGKRGDNYSSSFLQFSAAHYWALWVLGTLAGAKMCLCSCEMFTSLRFYWGFFFSVKENNDHADTVVPFELTEMRFAPTTSFWEAFRGDRERPRGYTHAYPWVVGRP